MFVHFHRSYRFKKKTNKILKFKYKFNFTHSTVIQVRNWNRVNEERNRTFACWCKNVQTVTLIYNTCIGIYMLNAIIYCTYNWFCLTKRIYLVDEVRIGNTRRMNFSLDQALARSTQKAYMSSWKSSKEGDLPLCILPKREILRETIPRH